MKKIITLFAIILSGAVAFAQQLHIKQFATLTHNDTVTGVWYGPTAFSDAHAAAVHGDIITLSPGTFNPTNITKAVTIRGHGMYFDSIANTEPTVVTGKFGLIVPNVEGLHLSIEGINFTGELMAYNQVYYPRFNKCKFNQVRTSTNGVIMSNPVFVDCIIGAFDGAPTASNVMFVNCVILETWTGTHRLVCDISISGYCSSGWYEINSNYNCGTSQDVYYNCIVNIPPEYIEYKRMIVNSIVYSSDTTQCASTNVSNTIGITDYIDYFATPSAGNNINLHSFESIFKTFRGTYTEGETFELTSQAASTYLGSDNTQVGIYGGSSPFNPKVTDMRILKVSPAYSSNGNNQLPVNVQLRAQ